MIGTVVTRGFGPNASIAFVVTRGFSIGGGSPVPPTGGGLLTQLMLMGVGR